MATIVKLSASLPSIAASDYAALPVFANATSIIKTVTCEPVGALYQRRMELQEFLERGLRDDAATPKKGHKDPNDTSEGSSPTGTRTRSDNKKVVKLSEEDLAVDWYDLLNLQNAEGSSEEQIRSAYRRRCLETHPDKQEDKSDELFKKVQRAFEILGDPDARRAYDSSRPFDDAIPGEDVSEEAFYTSFGPVFERNKKWSVHPLPSLGDDAATIKSIERFYDSWLHFHSWRDFSHECELDEIDDGMCREEKRFYQRENERILGQLRRQEMKRVRTLVDRARKNDPRLRKRREEEEAKRDAEKREREAEKQRLLDEELRRREELAEKDRKAQEERHRSIVEAKNAVKSAAQAVLEFFVSSNLLDSTATNMLLPNFVRKPNIQWYFSKASVEEAVVMQSIITKASTTAAEGSSDVPAVKEFNRLVEEKEQRIGINRYGEPVKKAASAIPAAPVDKAPKSAKAVAATQWSDDDLILLQKSIAKFPGGTVDRWRRIAIMMREKFTEEEVLAKTKELEAALRGNTNAAAPASTAAAPPAAAVAAAAGVPATAAPVVTVEDWTPKQQKQLEQGLRELKDYKEKDKYQKVAAYVDGKTAKQCFERFKFLCTLSKKS
jgi:DnaJ homolog subfamily C member 2